MKTISTAISKIITARTIAINNYNNVQHFAAFNAIAGKKNKNVSEMRIKKSSKSHKYKYNNYKN